MNEKILTTLGFDKVLARLARHTETSAGRELALALRPSIALAEVGHRQRETAEARRLLNSRGGLGLGDVRDIRSHAHKASLGGIIEPLELLDIAITLRAARQAANTVLRFDDTLSLLTATVRRIADLSHIADEISKAITPRGEVADSASPLLREVRRQIERSHTNLVSRMQSFLGSDLGKDVLQEPIVTQRDGRYVVPIKAEMRGRVRGIVHDVSSSGATVFVEPMDAVDLGNQWRELQAQERHEVERILRRLGAMVGGFSPEIVETVNAAADLDLAMAKARYGSELRAYDLPYDGADQSWLAEAPGEVRLIEAKHPLLGANVVPITLAVGGAYNVLLLTGPNTGGKTVALKTVGLLSLMAQAGLPVPAAEGSRLAIFERIYADIGDEQSIEQSLSTFSSHMTNIIEVMSEADDKSLALLDELGAGTDPAEGAALAQAILQHLLEAKVLTVATTHHGELKLFAHGAEGVMNASMEFDPDTLSPTYRVRVGLPGQSNALAIAARLGMPQDILDRAQAALSPEQIAMSGLLTDIQQERDEAVAARRAEEFARREAEEIRSGLTERIASLDAERESILAQARQELEDEIAETKERLRAAQRRLDRADRTTLAEAKVDITVAGQKVSSLRRRQPHRRSDERPREVALGDTVWLRGIANPGTVIAAPTDGEVEVQLGLARTRVPLDRIERFQTPGSSTVTPTRRPGGSRSSSAHPELVEGGRIPSTYIPALELDLRGLRADEAIARLDTYLDDAFRSGAPSIRVIHGLGTGVLRQQVRQLLSKHPLVSTFAPAERNAGGEGATMVQLAV